MQPYSNPGLFYTKVGDKQPLQPVVSKCTGRAHGLGIHEHVLPATPYHGCARYVSLAWAMSRLAPLALLNRVGCLLLRL